MQYCKHIGSNIFATVSTDKKKTYLNQEYGIPLENIFNSRNSYFYRDIMRRTKREGVDVILSSMSGDLLHQAWRCLKEFGCFVDLRSLDAGEGGKLDMTPFLGHRSFHSFNILNYVKHRPLECAKYAKVPRYESSGAESSTGLWRKFWDCSLRVCCGP